MIECHGPRTFFLAVSLGRILFFHRFLPCDIIFFSYDNLHPILVCVMYIARDEF